jgi:hypothetical protein
LPFCPAPEENFVVSDEHADDKFFIEAGIGQKKGSMVSECFAGRNCQGMMHGVRTEMLCA